MGDAAENSSKNTNTCITPEAGTKRRVRAGHTKAKGGCTTCKARHVHAMKPSLLACVA